MISIKLISYQQQLNFLFRISQTVQMHDACMIKSLLVASLLQWHDGKCSPVFCLQSSQLRLIMVGIASVSLGDVVSAPAVRNMIHCMCVIWTEQSVNHVELCFVFQEQMCVVCLLCLSCVSLIVTLCLSLSFCGCILILLFHIWMPLKSIRPSPSLRTFHLPYFSSAELRWRIHKSTAGGSLLSDRRSSLKMCV